jgi:hypothetical protein
LTYLGDKSALAARFTTSSQNSTKIRNSQCADGSGPCTDYAIHEPTNDANTSGLRYQYLYDRHRASISAQRPPKSTDNTSKGTAGVEDEEDAVHMEDIVLAPLTGEQICCGSESNICMQYDERQGLAYKELHTPESHHPDQREYTRKRPNTTQAQAKNGQLLDFSN